MTHWTFIYTSLSHTARLCTASASFAFLHIIIEQMLYVLCFTLYAVWSPATEMLFVELAVPVMVKLAACCNHRWHCASCIYHGGLSDRLTLFSFERIVVVVKWHLLQIAAQLFGGVYWSLCCCVVASRSSAPPARPLCQHTRVINWAPWRCSSSSSSSSRDDTGWGEREQLIRNCDVANPSDVSSSTICQDCRSLDDW